MLEKKLGEDSLYGAFYRMLKTHFQRVQGLLNEVGIYQGQPVLLYSLFYKGGMSQKELADKMGVKPATLTVMISRMEKAGLIERKVDEKDQRISRVHLTEEGIKTFHIVDEKMKQVEEECFGNFTLEEKVLLRRMFLQVRENLIHVMDQEEKK